MEYESLENLELATYTGFTNIEALRFASRELWLLIVLYGGQSYFLVTNLISF